jgi:hypothetical protein
VAAIRMLCSLVLFALGYGVIYLVSTEYRPARYGALLCTDPAALPGGRWNSDYDGAWLGAQGCLYDPVKRSLEEVPAVRDPRSFVPGTAELIYVNGANHRVEWTLPELHLLAQQTGGPVISVYNATEGGRIPDAIHDARQGAASPPVATLATAILQRLGSGGEIHLKANSQGAIHLRHALERVRASLSARLAADDVAHSLHRIRVETAGGAAARWPDGPRYVHYVNLRDPVPKRAGVLSKGAHAGAGAVLATFSDFDADPLEPKYRFVGPLSRRFVGVHGFGIYHRHRQPFDLLYAHSRPGTVQTISLDGRAAAGG